MKARDCGIRKFQASRLKEASEQPGLWNFKRILKFAGLKESTMVQDLHRFFSQEFNLFESKFQSLLQGDFPVIDPIGRQIFKNKGKQLRPMLLFCTHKLFKEEVGEQAFLAASLIEIVHAASLIHDDVVDMADLRRGEASVRAMFGNKTAVLAGDYLLSNAFLKAYGHSENKILHYLVEVIRLMSEGELLQLKYAGNPDANEETYFQIIERKTAALFSCCCRCGAVSAQASPAQTGLCEEIGKNIGIAFQIKDDLLDLDTRNDNGKSYGNDLKENKLTLPALYMLQHCPEKEKEQFLKGLSRLSAGNGEENEPGLLDRLISRVKDSGGEEYARGKALSYREKAFEAYRKLNRPYPVFEELLCRICPE